MFRRRAQRVLTLAVAGMLLVFTLTGMESCGTRSMNRIGFWTGQEDVVTLHNDQGDEITVSSTCLGIPERRVVDPHLCQPALRYTVNGNTGRVVGYGIIGGRQYYLEKVNVLDLEKEGYCHDLPGSGHADLRALFAALISTTDQRTAAILGKLERDPAVATALQDVLSISALRHALERALALSRLEEKGGIVRVLTQAGLSGSSAAALAGIISSHPDWSARLLNSLSLVEEGAASQRCPDGGALEVSGPGGIELGKGSTDFEPAQFDLLFDDYDGSGGLPEGVSDYLDLHVDSDDADPGDTLRLRLTMACSGCVAIATTIHD